MKVKFKLKALESVTLSMINDYLEDLKNQSEIADFTTPDFENRDNFKRKVIFCVYVDMKASAHILSIRDFKIGSEKLKVKSIKISKLC